MSYQTSSKMPRPFWLLIGAENFCVFLPSQKATSLWVVSCVLTRNDICSSVARHVSLGRSPRLCSRWKVPILAQNVRNIFRYLRENLTGKDAGPFAGIITVAYLKVCENIHRFTDVFWIQGEGGGGGGGKGGAVVRALASHHFDTGTDPCTYALCGCWGSCWFSPLLREFFLWVLRSVPLSLETNLSKFQFNQESSRSRTTNRSGCATSKSLLINLFKCRSVPGLMIYVGPT